MLCSVSSSCWLRVPNTLRGYVLTHWTAEISKGAPTVPINLLYANVTYISPSVLRLFFNAIRIPNRTVFKKEAAIESHWMQRIEVLWKHGQIRNSLSWYFLFPPRVKIKRYRQIQGCYYGLFKEREKKGGWNHCMDPKSAQIYSRCNWNTAVQFLGHLIWDFYTIQINRQKYGGSWGMNTYVKYDKSCSLKMVPGSDFFIITHIACIVNDFSRGYGQWTLLSKTAAYHKRRRVLDLHLLLLRT